MTSWLMALVLATVPTPALARNDYGVPIIHAPTVREAFVLQGYAVAQDRLWQMERTRRLARGRMAAAFGPSFVRSDAEVLQTGYSDAELRAQFEAMRPESRALVEAYAEGVNRWIAEAQHNGRLPKGYAEANLRPEPWDVLDTVAICVHVGRLFGRGGAGELRNFALLRYLSTQPCKDRVLDVFDDFAWYNDSRSIPTVSPTEDPLAKDHPRFSAPSRSQTRQQWEQLPKLGLLELAPAIRLAERTETREAAIRTASPFQFGSYCIVVGASRSATGRPLLLSGPQMGFSIPSIGHEVAISAPGYTVSGLDVPGIPGVVVGVTPLLAWGLTSGVADTDDIFWAKTVGPDQIEFGDQRRPLRTESRQIEGTDQKIEVKRTEWGPVVLESKGEGVVFFRRSTLWMREMQSFDAMLDIPRVRNAKEMDQLLSRVGLSFNAFFATADGDIGWRYCGHVPIRAPGVDPRLPQRASPATDWQGRIPWRQMPRVDNPKNGLITNWNNKPASWWPNFDTPVWGRVFRNETLNRFLRSTRISVPDLEFAAWSIARVDDTADHFMPMIRAALDPEPSALPDRRAWAYLQAYRGWDLEGSQGAVIYKALLRALREELFVGSVGNMLTPELFQTAIQPSLLLEAMEGKTKYPYLGRRRRDDVIRAAFTKAVERLAASMGTDPGEWQYVPGGINAPDGPPIPYSNRGSYIQIVEMGDRPVGRSVLPPGVAESGAHSADQVPLARSWTYKRMPLTP